MPMDLSRDEAVAGDAARSAWEEVSEHTGEDEKTPPGAKASVPASSVHPIEDTTDSDLPSFHINRPCRHPSQGEAETNQVAGDTNGDLSKENSEELGFMELQSSGAVINHVTAPDEIDEEKQKLQCNNVKKLSDEDVIPLYTVLASDELADGELGVISIPKEQDTPFEEEPNSEPTRDLDACAAPRNLDVPSELADENSQRPLQDDDNGEHATHNGITNPERDVQANHPEKDKLGMTELTTFEDGNSRCLQGRIDGSKEEMSDVEEPPTTFERFHGSPEEASNNDTQEATEIPAAAAAFNVEFSEAPRAVSASGNSQEEVGMPAMSRGAAEGEIVAAFAHDPIASPSGETEPSHVDAAEEAADVPPAALKVELSEPPKAVNVSANSQEEGDIHTSGDSAETETVAHFAHDPVSSSSGETEASHANAAEEATAVPAALNVELSEAPKAVSVYSNSQEEVDMPAPSRESAEDETVAPFAHNPMSSLSGETEASHVHAAEEATATTPTSTTGETRDVSLPQELEGNLPNNYNKFNADRKQGESADTSEFPGGHYYTAHTGDPLNIVDPPDNLGRSSQGHDSPGTKARSGIHGDSSRSHEKSVSDVDLYADLAPIPYSGPITYSGPISAAYSYTGANHSGSFPFSGSISHRSDSSAASNRSFAFPIFSTDWNSSPVRMAQPDRRYLQRKRRWRPSCMCCSRPSPTY